MKKDIPENVYDLAANNDFIEWVKTGFEHNDTFWTAQKAAYDLSDFDQAISLVQNIYFETYPYEAARSSALLDRINASIDNEIVEAESAKSEDVFEDKNPKEKSQSKVISLIKWLSSGAVAAMIAFFVYSWFGNYETINLKTDFANAQQEVLPDNTIININAGSYLTHNVKNTKRPRKLFLRGEAHFNVTKGEPFVIETDYVSIEVLGTIFNVYAREDGFEVSCTEGKIRVVNKAGNKNMILTAGESCMASNKEFKQTASNRSNWVKGTFEFKEVPLSFVLDEIERQYNINIQVADSLAQIPYTGYFETGDLDKSFESVLWTLNLKQNKLSIDRYEIVK